jgi:hypothetical protein
MHTLGALKATDALSANSGGAITTGLKSKSIFSKQKATVTGLKVRVGILII